MKKLSYLIFNLVIITGPTLAIIFYRPIILPVFIPMFLALIISAVIFIILDEMATGYFWYFNHRYLTGVFLGKLPIEEILFFLTVPFACLILWVNLQPLLPAGNLPNYFSGFIFIVFLLTTLISFQKKLWYTAAVLAGFWLILLLDIVSGIHLTNNYSFWFFMLIVNFLTLVFNGYLVNQPIVKYFSKTKSGYHLINIPIEDFIYGMSLIYLNLLLYQWFINFYN